MSEHSTRDYSHIPLVEGTSALKEDLYEVAVADLGMAGVGEAVVIDFPTSSPPETMVVTDLPSVVEVDIAMRLFRTTIRQGEDPSQLTHFGMLQKISARQSARSGKL